MTIPRQREFCVVNTDKKGISSSVDFVTPASATHPVRIMLPGFNVVPCERKETILGIVKIRSLI